MLVIGRVAAALLSGALLAQAHGLQPYWPLAWAAAIPLLVAVIGASRMIAFLCGAIAGALSVAEMFAYMLELTGPAPLAVIVVLKALIWGGAALAASFAERRLPAAAAVFVFPTLMAGVETLIAAVSPHGTAGAFALGNGFRFLLVDDGVVQVEDLLLVRLELVKRIFRSILFVRQ